MKVENNTMLRIFHFNITLKYDFFKRECAFSVLLLFPVDVRCGLVFVSVDMLLLYVGQIEIFRYIFSSCVVPRYLGNSLCLCNDKVVFLFLLQTSLLSWEPRHQTLTRLRERSC